MTCPPPFPPSPDSTSLQQILCHIPGGIYELWQHPDGNFSIPYASQKLWDIYRIAGGELPEDAKGMFAAIHPEDRPVVLESLQESATHLSPWHSTHRVCNADGECIWVVSQGIPERQPDGSTKWYGLFQNITHLKKAQQHSENKLIRLIENLNDMVFIITPDGSFSFISPMMSTVMGYPLTELKSQPFSKFVHAEDLHICVNGFQSALSGQKVRGLEYRVLHEDGQYYWHSANLSGFQEDEESEFKCLGIASYIEPRKQADLALAESNIQLQLALESSNTGLWDWNLRTNEVAFNKQWKTMLGYDEHEIQNTAEQWEILVYPDDLPEAHYQIEQHLNKLNSIYKNEHRLRCKDGSYKWILDQGRVVEWDREGNPVRFIGTHTDISEIKQGELALLELSNQLKKAQEVAHLGYWSYDLTTQKITWSEEVFRIFNRHPNQGEPTLEEFLQQIHPGDRNFWLERMAAAEQGNPQTFDFSILWADGTIRYLSNWIELELQGEQVVREFGVVMDITERRVAEIEYQASLVKRQELEQAYQELKQAQVQLIQAEKMSSLGQLVAGIAHEINNPVSFIYGNLDPLLEYNNSLLEIIKLYQSTYPQPRPEIIELVDEVDLEFLKEDLPNMIQSMKTGADRIKKIVTSLRTFSRLDESDLKEVDLHENIDNTLMILQNQLNGRDGNPEITVIKNYGNLPKVNCYIGLLNQVFMNLIINGIQAIKEKRRNQVDSMYQGLLNITTSEDDDGVTISVQDNGIGMTREVKAKIFEPFFTTKPVGSGTGMGLPTSHQIVTKYHQGEFYFESKLGEGTTFTIRLPRLKPSPTDILTTSDSL